MIQKTNYWLYIKELQCKKFKKETILGLGKNQSNKDGRCHLHEGVYLDGHSSLASSTGQRSAVSADELGQPVG